MLHDSKEPAKELERVITGHWILELPKVRLLLQFALTSCLLTNAICHLLQHLSRLEVF